MNKIRGTKGITLIALVITIIILLILASITLSTLTGENGLFTRAKEAKQNSLDAQELENSALLDYEKQIEELGGSKREVQETDIYVKLYKDGTLTFSSSKDKKVDGKDLDNSYNDENIRGKAYTNRNDNAPLWYSDRASITSVVVLDEIVPISTAMWFMNCTNLISLDLNNLNTSKVTDMVDMFRACNSITNLDVSNFNTSNVTNMSGMFDGGSSLTSLDLSKFDTTSVTDMSYMFRDCSNLTNLDLSSFNTSNVTNMYCMFLRCSNLTKIEVSSNWVTTNITSNTDMFTECGTNQVTIK